VVALPTADARFCPLLRAWVSAEAMTSLWLPSPEIPTEARALWTSAPLARAAAKAVSAEGGDDASAAWVAAAEEAVLAA
jgi:hypothetical protein